MMCVLVVELCSTRVLTWARHEGQISVVDSGPTAGAKTIENKHSLRELVFAVTIDGQRILLKALIIVRCPMMQIQF